MSIPRPIPRPIKIPIGDFPEVNKLLNDPTLEGLYLFEPSTRLLDSSGNKVYGTITGATWQGNSLLFSNDNVNFGNNFNLANVTSKISVFLLLRVNTLGSGVSAIDKAVWTIRKTDVDTIRFQITDDGGVKQADTTSTVSANCSAMRSQLYFLTMMGLALEVFSTAF